MELLVPERLAPALRTLEVLEGGRAIKMVGEEVVVAANAENERGRNVAGFADERKRGVKLERGAICKRVLFANRDVVVLVRLDDGPEVCPRERQHLLEEGQLRSNAGNEGTKMLGRRGKLTSSVVPVAEVAGAFLEDESHLVIL